MQTLDHKVNGAAVFWASAPARRAAIVEGLDALGLASHSPPVRSQYAILHNALADIYAAPTTLVRSTEKTGRFAVVNEDRGETENDYTHMLTAYHDDDGRLVLEGAYAGDRGRIEAAMENASKVVTALAVTQSLVKIVTALGGVGLRPAGGCYWLPDDRVPLWTRVAAVFEASYATSAERTEMYCMRTTADADSLRAIQAAVVRDTQAEVAKIYEDVSAGDLGGRAIESRRDELARLAKRLSIYECIVGTGLHAIRAVLEEAQTAAAHAAVLASAKKEAAHAA